MIRWALRSLLTQPLSFAASVLGLAVALLMVLLLEGIFEGESDQIVRYLEVGGTDVWVMQEGVHNMHMATSFLPPTVEGAVTEVAGVAHANSILYFGASARFGDAPGRFLYIVGIDEDAPLGGPWAMAEGRPRPRPGEAVVPRILADKHRVGLGADLVVSDRAFRVVGISDETFSMANPIVFLNRSDVDTLLGTSGAASFVLVKAADGVEPSALAARIRESVEKIEAHDSASFAAYDRALAIQMGGELILIMTFVSALVSVLIVAWTVSGFVARQTPALAVAKALGARNGQVVAAVVAQSLVLATFGFVAAIAIAFALEPLLAMAVPDVVVHFKAPSVLRVGLVSIAVACVAAIMPARRVVQVDPASVFS